MKSLLTFSCLVLVAISINVHHGDRKGQPFSLLGPDDYIFVGSLPQRRVTTDIPGFQYVFVDANGNITDIRGSSGTQIEIAGSPLSSSLGLIVAADVVAKMTKNMPSNIFTQLASSASVGIFTAAEKLTVYPEFAYLASGSCGSRCNGSCSHTCTADGRKYENIAGIGSLRAVVLEDNVLCTAHDPYLHTQNILSHEFTHTIHDHGLPTSVKHQITAAYNAAKANSTWVLSSYAMTNDHEYFAEGGSVFFFVNRDNSGSGGMSSCGASLCATEHDAREHLLRADPGLFNALNYVFTGNHSDLVSGLSVCPHTTVVG